MKRILFWMATLLVALTPLVAQEQSETLNVAVIPVNNTDPRDLADDLANVLAGQISIRPADRALIVRGSEDVIRVVEEAVRKLDVPRTPAPTAAVPNVELTVQLIYGSAQAGEEEPLPDDLASTIEQLRALFPYQSYRLMDSQLLRGRDHERTEASGVLPISGIGISQPTVFNFRFTPEVADGAPPHTVRLRELRLGLRLPVRMPDSAEGETRFNYVDSGITTELDAREGQKTVVGKSNVGNADAVILVVTPRVIE